MILRTPRCQITANIVALCTHHGQNIVNIVVLHTPCCQINANMMVPVRLVEMADPISGLHYYHVRLMRCPKQNLSADS